jgi:signal transduction histidine kinase
MRLYDLAISYYEQALNIFHSLDENAQTLRDIGCCHQGIGSNLIKKEEYQKSIEHYEKSLEFLRKINDKHYSGYSFGGLAECYMALGKDEEFQKNMSEFDEFVKNINNQFFLYSVSNKKAKYYYQQRQYKKSLEYAKEALSLISKSDKRNLAGLYETLALASSHAGTPQETAGYIEKLNQLKKEAFDEERTKSVTEMEVRYETAKKELEIEQQQHIIVRQNMHRNVLAAAIVVSAIILVLLWYMLALRNRRNRALTERNNALAEMNATKNKFFNIISHDLKNPAVSQRTALQKLIKHAQLWDADTLTEYYHDLLKSADGQVELIYNLLGWAQLQTGRMAFTPDTFVLADILPDISLICKMAENKDITFTAQFPQNTLVTCDRNMISSVICNLLTNAIKFTSAGGQVTFDVTPVSSLSDRKGTPLQHTISIIDTGVGMTPEQIQNLFRLDTAHSRTGTAGEQGSGLGLIVCKEFLEKHGSKLHVESEEGKGSRFWFTLN